VTTTLTAATLERLPGGGVLVLSVARGKKSSCDIYRVTRLDCADVAYRLRKLTEGTDEECQEYDVNLTDDSCGCTCRGYLRWSKCKHRGALLDLIERGELL
jgi:hypothetical protein